MAAEFHYDRYPFGFVDPSDRAALEASHPPLLRDVVKALPSEALLLDIGSGPGRLAIWAASRGVRVIGLDRSIRSLRALRANCAAVSVAVADALAPPCSEQAALVVLDGVAHHTESPAGALSSAAAACRRGGLVYVAVYKRWTYYHLAYVTVGRVLRRCDRRPGFGWAVRVGRLAYGWLHRLRRGRKPEAFIDSLFADYFLTPRASFHSRREVLGWAAGCGLQQEAYDRFPAGNCHLFLFRKA